MRVSSKKDRLRGTRQSGRAAPKERKNREDKKRKILAAVSDILRAGGFAAVRINNVARRAGVNKVLLYRYFGDLPGLLNAYVASKVLFRPAPRISDYASYDKNEAVLSTAESILIGTARALRADSELQELYRRELNEADDLTKEISAGRERFNIPLLEEYSRYIDFRGTDIPALNALLSGGLTYLVLLSKTSEHFQGVGLRSEQDWRRIEKSLSFFLDLLKTHVSRSRMSAE